MQQIQPQIIQDVKTKLNASEMGGDFDSNEKQAKKYITLVKSEGQGKQNIFKMLFTWVAKIFRMTQNITLYIVRNI